MPKPRREEDVSMTSGHQVGHATNINTGETMVVVQFIYPGGITSPWYGLPVVAIDVLVDDLQRMKRESQARTASQN